MPEISIIVPVYKVEDYLDRCVESILAQTFTDFELILVDDGSPDRCPEMCEAWARRDSRIKVVHKENGGPSSARNVGLNLMSGDYVCFVDSDDWVAEDMCEYLLDVAKKFSADIVTTPPIVCDGVTQVSDDIEKIDVLTSKEFVERIFKVHTRATEHYNWGKLYKACLWRDIRFPDYLDIGEDLLCMFETTLESERIVRSNQRKYFYYCNKDSITNGKFTTREFDYLKIWDKVCKVAQKCDDADIQYWAQMNRYRADFGLLCKAAVREIPKECEDEVRLRLEVCRKNLKSHYWQLMRYSLPIDRKVMMTLICIQYRMFCWLVQGGRFLQNCFVRKP